MSGGHSDRGLVVYRSARSINPHLGQLSFSVTNTEHAARFALWEAEEYPEPRGPSSIYRTEIPRDRLQDLR